MTWSNRFRAREYVRGSLWLLPLVGGVLGVAVAVVTHETERSVDLPSYWTYSSSTATAVLVSIVGATAALTGFVVTVTVLVVQMAAGTFSPRYMRLWYRDRLLKATLATLVGTLTFSLGLLRQTEDDSVPNLGVTVAGALVAVSLILFLLFFNRFIHRLRPVAVTAHVARAGQEAIGDAMRATDRDDVRWEAIVTNDEPTMLVQSDRAGSIQAVDLDGLVRWADAHDADLILAHAVGDFVPTGGTLIRVYGATTTAESAERELAGLVALGDERTIQQDPAFAIRIMVDIAIRALSPAVNDPTTAVQVIDYLGETLRQVGSSGITPSLGPHEGESAARVVIRARPWEDYMALGVSEIRHFGATSIQVVRRLRAMLEELGEAVLAENRAAVEDELRRLDATVAENWGSSVDFDRASVAGPQGIGGRVDTTR